MLWLIYGTIIKKKNSFINFTTSENDIDADFHTTLNTGMLEDSKQLY